MEDMADNPEEDGLPDPATEEPEPGVQQDVDMGDAEAAAAPAKDGAHDSQLSEPCVSLMFHDVIFIYVADRHSKP